MARTNSLTQKRLKELLDYDPNIGEFKWKSDRKRVKSGSLAGHNSEKHGIKITIDYIAYQATHLAWFYVYGIKPKRVWAINGNLKDLSIQNLSITKPKTDFPVLTQKNLRKILDYNPDTGIFRWKVRNARKLSIGDYAGWVDRQGYIRTRIYGKLYANHRLAWLYIYGYFPENDVDHINQIKNDNRIENLREISRICNTRNSGNSSNNKSGIKGVCFDKNRKKWIVQLRVGKKSCNIGRYASKDDAVCARLAAEQCLDWSGCDSNSPAFQYVKKYINKNAK